jgi:hypothetical protein
MTNRVPFGVCSCIFCGEQLIWKSDVPFKELGLNGEGILVSLECSSCEAVCAFVSKPSEKINLEWDKWLSGLIE